MHTQSQSSTTPPSPTLESPPRLVRNVHLITDDGEAIPIGPQHPEGLFLGMNQAAADIYLARLRRTQQPTDLG